MRNKATVCHDFTPVLASLRRTYLKTLAQAASGEEIVAAIQALLDLERLAYELASSWLDRRDHAGLTRFMAAAGHEFSREILHRHIAWTRSQPCG